MIKFTLYFTSVLLSFIDQSQMNGWCFMEDVFVNITPICDPNEDTINNNAVNTSEGDPNEDTINNNAVNTSEDNTVNNSEDLLCHICQQETNSVTISPCGHIVGNYCANKFSRGDVDCPFCIRKIENFENLFSLTDHEFEKRSPYRLRVLTENETNNLKSKIQNGMTDEEFMARFWYLRRCQEPDRSLLLNIRSHIITLDDRIYIAELKGKLLSGEISEIDVYKNHFKQELNNIEYVMLYLFYTEFQNPYKEYEFKVRNNYLDFIYT
ncbi:uncharacterized protein LOC126904078 isoform X4 [Daktulosphaira vitifoliae]|uniref:uncharacterized protein LOC126904078 isoform X4 n=1 Tax=Daktulosphaira vitifoliae TaxID=58002 RepID=UPI0021A9AE0D|nr:uncharacterized protein LOC126904078 isoform X4 [Daktulosphaira vitifoliae]